MITGDDNTLVLEDSTLYTNTHSSSLTTEEEDIMFKILNNNDGANVNIKIEHNRGSIDESIISACAQGIPYVIEGDIVTISLTGWPSQCKIRSLFIDTKIMGRSISFHIDGVPHYLAYSTAKNPQMYSSISSSTGETINKFNPITTNNPPPRSVWMNLFNNQLSLGGSNVLFGVQTMNTNKANPDIFKITFEDNGQT
jgi:hypothetical protein